MPSELTGDFLPRVAGIDPQTELARILATRPQFILRRSDTPARANPAVYAQLDQALAADYALWRTYPGVLVYRLTEGRAR